MKLTTYILSLLCVLGFCASFITGYFVYNTVVTNTIQNLSESQLKHTQQTHKDLDYTLHEAFRGIVAIANFYSHTELPDETNSEKSRKMLIDVANELSTPWDALHIFDRSGNLRLSKTCRRRCHWLFLMASLFRTAIQGFRHPFDHAQPGWRLHRIQQSLQHLPAFGSVFC